MPGRPYPSYPEADRASPEYAYVDPQNAFYDIAKLPREYHPLDAWNLLGKNEMNSKLDSTFYPAILAATGVGSSIYQNWSSKAPLWSHLPRTILAGVAGVIAGQFAWKVSQERAARRDAVLKKFLEDHYDEFPMIKRVKYGEVFMPWRASR